MKGDEYEKACKRKLEDLILQMRFYTFGKETMTKKELKRLYKLGIFKPRLRREAKEYQGSSEEDEPEPVPVPVKEGLMFNVEEFDN